MHLFAVLGDPVRFRVVEILASGSHLAGELTDAIVGEFHVSRSTVSHHLRILRDERVVVIETDGNERIYRLRWNALDRIDHVLLDLFEKWDRREGWPYRTDPLATPPRRHRLTERVRNRVSVIQSEIEPAAPIDESEWWAEDEPDEDAAEEDAAEEDAAEAEPARYPVNSRLPNSPHDEAKPA